MSWLGCPTIIIATAAFVGTYSGECVVNGEPMRVELEFVRNESLGSTGADATLSLYKNGETSPVARLTMRGGIRNVRASRRRGDTSPPTTKREFSLSTMDPSETFGGHFSLHLEEDGAALKGTLSLVKRQRGPDTVDQLPITLTRTETSESEEPKVSTHPSGDADAKIDSSDVTGVYDGVLTAEKRQFFAQLRLHREGPNDLAGELSFSATASDREPLGSFKLKGKFDPANNTFKLSSGGELTSSDGLILATANGDFEPGSGKIRAELTPRGGTLELTRNAKKTAELQAKSTESARRLAEGPVSLIKAGTDQERRDAIVRWFSRLKREYPDIDLHHTVLNEIFPKVLNLFGDDDFVPVFGKPFEAMTADDRNYVKQLFRRLFIGPEKRELLSPHASKAMARDDGSDENVVADFSRL